MDTVTNSFLSRVMLKYKLGRRTKLYLPTPYPENTIKHFGIHADEPHIWVECVTNPARMVERYFEIFGTGQPVTGSHVATCFDRHFVWHLYELGESEAAKWPTD